MLEQQLMEYIAAVPDLDRAAMAQAARRQAELAKPPGSLGKLEEYAVRLAGLTGQVCPTADVCRVAVFAADNGVVAEGVSITPPGVTLRQSAQMTRRKTGMSAMADFFGDSVVVYDVGIAGRTPPAVVDCKLRHGTGNIAVEPAVTRREAIEAVGVGLEAARQAKRDGVQALGIGEMGIGNTTTSAAVLAALTGRAAFEVTGRGAGLTDAAFAKKKEVVARALARHKPEKTDVLDVLCKVGGLDIAAMCGAYIGCAGERIAAVADGYISAVAALCAVRLCPRVQGALFLSHASCEPGYAVAAQELGQEPCLALNMRLGEGSGCVLLFRVLQAACAAMSGMATFAQAAIDEGYLAPLRGADADGVTP